MQEVQLVLPWMVGPLVASGELVQFVKPGTPLGVVSGFIVNVARDHGVTVLSIVPGAMLSLGILIVSRLGGRSEPASRIPFESPAIPPPALPAVEPDPRPQALPPERVQGNERVR